jgi:hypothetical protein
MRRDDICLYLGPTDRAELQALIANCNTARKVVSLRANKSETFDCLMFTLEGAGERFNGNARTSAHLFAFFARRSCNTVVCWPRCGAPMKAKATALMLADLSVVKSHSRPHTSNDNPFSEAHFKTLKYQPEFPKRFETIDEARAFCRRFFTWYNEDHHHAGIGLMTPDQIHFGQADTIHAARQTALDLAFLNTPERFVGKRPKPPQIPKAVWINPPKQTEPVQA